MGTALFITGTGTEIGKSVVTSLIVLALERLGCSTCVFKPVQTGMADDGISFAEQHWYQQVVQLSHFEGMYRMEPAMSPHLAAALTGTSIEPERIAERLASLRQRYDVVLVEGAGGLAVPWCERGGRWYMTCDFVRDYELPVILVSLSGLGAIHHAVTTATYAETQGVRVLGLVFNQFDEREVIHRNNIETITAMLKLPAFATVPPFSAVTREELEAFAGQWIERKEAAALWEVLAVEV
ncbi:ATP-dependent dethiobiotin synthetase BioD [Geobacillus subterraneus]|uniref:ATP-dependent dethiobiotin synthetase BioD n=2 Tax=Geobacillus TaxID=129337 RepID=A0ABM6A896_9BACL|nr:MULTISPECIES: dethiobiotin synthase [Geobacillus]AMX82395.1 ATP-dependent dethiobiotin synthetase BioD [Geobacillus subterraneus]KZS26609.1 ATP-dependent dethiobiotin synthetase BioD [Geobacillus subterraneus]OXB91426.1 dethiobiotin synthase [Geobacillus uzenensis]WPZ17984.1 dethiobiotin synthase [Geobacillus subterraneus]